ncbi:MAG TPA: hypothetical protein VHZ52_15830 [Acidobacteriaceae bacterium]|jgi:hypothetical protein|nr:hypothetical protein [Acidobacteriaceae bacterium]
MSGEINQARIQDEVAIHEEEEKVSNFAHRALWMLIHTLMAICSWVAMILAISLARPESVPVLVTLAASFTAPFIVGNIFTRIKQNNMAPYTWLIGVIWFLIICLWILDMPTGPNQCYHCDATQKIYLTFFSPTEDSGLIDGQGRFVGTWPAVAFIGYGIGSSFALRRKKPAQ